MILDQQIRLDDISDDYKQFVEKFKPKKTTDDCYTPEKAAAEKAAATVWELSEEERAIVRGLG